MIVEYSKRAIADLSLISDHYRSVADARVAERFEERFRTVIERVCRRPESSRPVVQRPGVRIAFLISFPYKVFYRVIGTDRIKILHVRHTARRTLGE